jgi:addiction module HigA family antidote
MKPTNNIPENYSVDFAANEDIWTDEKADQLNAVVKDIIRKRTPERKIKNEILSIGYKIEEYLKKEIVAENEIKTQETFLNEYLHALNIPFRQFSEAIDTSDSNLKKYLKGQRGFSFELAMKFGHFFHTSPEIWLALGIKNMFIMRKNEANGYDKYDYRKVLKSV